MYPLCVLFAFLAMVASGLASNLSQSQPNRVPFDPIDQGGDSCTDAVEIPCVPFCDAGSTEFAIDNFTPPCLPLGDAPDVIYKYTPEVNETLTVSTCGSSYYTVIHIYAGCPPNGALICCNAAFLECEPDRACCEGVEFLAGIEYFIIIDGGTSLPSRGSYVLYVGPDACQSYDCPDQFCSFSSRDLEAVNDSCNVLDPLVLCDSTHCGEIDEPTEQDWYRFHICECSRVNINVFGNDTPDYYPYCRGLNPYVEFYKDDCVTQVDFDLNGGIGNDARLNMTCVEPGLYYIKIGAQAGNFGPYVLAVSCLPDNCCDDCIDCPAWAYVSPEPCDNIPDNYDGGCGTGSGINPHELVPPFEQFCGTIRTGMPGQPADQDWYILKYDPGDSPTYYISWSIFSSVPVTFGIAAIGVGPMCPSLDILACGAVDACHDSGYVSTCVLGGGYLLFVKGQNDGFGCCGEYTATLSIVDIDCTVLPPLAPADVTVTRDFSVPGGPLVLAWQPVLDATEYRVFRSSNPDSIVTDMTAIGLTTATSFHDSAGITDAIPGTTYYYQVVSYRAINAGCPGD